MLVLLGLLELGGANRTAPTRSVVVGGLEGEY